MEADTLTLSRAEAIDAGDETSPGVPANTYRTDNYVVFNVGLPACPTEHIRVTLAPNGLLVEAERHPADPFESADRHYTLEELPMGNVRRALRMPEGLELALDEAEARFGHGMLTVSIPSVAREGYREAYRAGSGRPMGG